MERDNRGHNKNNNPRRNDHNDRNKQEEIVKIDQPLHIYYADKSKLFLENGIAYTIAKQLKSLPSHQLRKVLNQSKLCVQEISSKALNFESVRNKLFMLLPLSAYNKGRNSKTKEYGVLYEFLVRHLNMNSITVVEDVKVFDELMTSIVAYHKFFGGK